MSYYSRHAPLLDWEVYDTETEMAVRESIYQHRTLETATLGDLWWGSYCVKPWNFYNPAVVAREHREWLAQRELELEARRERNREEAEHQKQVDAMRQTVEYQEAVMLAQRRALLALAEFYKCRSLSTEI